MPSLPEEDGELKMGDRLSIQTYRQINCKARRLEIIVNRYEVTLTAGNGLELMILLV